ncbi:hypothetical protein SDC9_130913 [bioreactor metagenome]|uniref:Uncharacterized protein n=1 Tax=bioreactor metagenome TaxID=1076179 RepID=A0A645D3H8_9ZZZZ
MYQAGLAAIGWLVFDVGTPGLEIAHIGDGRDFQPFIAARRPDLNIVGDAGIEAKIARAQAFDAVGQAKAFAGILGVFKHLFQLGS